MPATESVNLFSSLASTSAVLMSDAMDGTWLYIGLGLTVIICGSILTVLVKIVKGRRYKFKTRRIQ